MNKEKYASNNKSIISINDDSPSKENDDGHYDISNEETQTSLYKNLTNKQKPQGRHIKTFCRIRPFDGVNTLFFKFKNLHPTTTIIKGDHPPVTLTINKSPYQNKLVKELGNKFHFNEIFDEGSNQIEIFKDTCLDLVNQLVEEKKCSILISHGLKNSGKTYTTVGDADNPGLIPLSMRFIFDKIREKKDQKSIKMFCNYIEIFEDKAYDLFKKNKLIDIKSWNRYSLVGSTNYSLKSIQDCSDAINTGTKNMRTKHGSSQSHTLFRIILHFYRDERRYDERSFVIVDVAADINGYIDLKDCTLSKENELKPKKEEFLLFTYVHLVNTMKILEESPSINNKRVFYNTSLFVAYLKQFIHTDDSIVLLTNIHPSSDKFEDNLRVLSFAKLFYTAVVKVDRAGNKVDK
jgi:hypothetical protein